MRISLSFAAATVVALASVAVADPDHPRLAYVASDGQRAELPIVASRIDAIIRGPIAQITLTQTYANTLTEPIDAVYVFPMPDDAAVSGMTLTAGDRRVRAVIKRRDEARAVYDKAKRDGRMAALLDQERPNVFTQSIANLQPNEQIGVELSYDVLLQPEDGTYHLALPTVVGPRYIPGTALDPPAVGGGTAPDTDRVPDASRISPPVTTGTGNAIALAIDLDAGVPVRAVDSPTHKLVVTSRGDTARTIALAADATVADRDLVITWRVDVPRPTVAALADHDADHGHVALIVQPPALPPARDTAPPRELVFVIDTSGSMEGMPLQLAQAGVRRALAQLRPGDRFRILNFSVSVGGLDDGASLGATAANRDRAIAYVDDLQSSGGTEMLSGVRAALAPPTSGFDSYVVFMTDGFIGNDTEILAAIADLLDPHTRLFSFGIGSSVNRFLLDRMAKVGGGAVDYILPGDDGADAAIDRFLGRLDAPVLTDLKVDWGGLDVVDQTPDVLPTLYAGQPIVVVARYAKGGRGTIKITGTRAGKKLTYSQEVALPATGARGAVLGRLWARRRIEALDREQDAGARSEIADEITAIALQHGLMSAYTSFVAVEDHTRRAVADRTVEVPVELPAGVSPDAVTELDATGRDYGAALGSAPGISIDDDAEPDALRSMGETLSISGDTWAASGLGDRGRWHGSLDGALAITAHRVDPATGDNRKQVGGALTGALERQFAGRFCAGLEASWLARVDRDDLTTLSAVLARWALLKWIHLRAGLGAALRFDGAAGLAWHVRAGFALPLHRSFGPELSVRVGQARIDADDDAVTVGIGLGLRF